MRIVILQALSVLLLILAVVWFVFEPGFEPVITAVAGLVGLFSAEVIKPGSSSTRIPTDQRTDIPSGSGSRDPRKKSIVVLPFDNMSSDSGDVYFSDGLTEEIITSLSLDGTLRVISRSSAMVLKGTQKDVRTIGRELDVQYVLEGSVRRAGEDLRITAQLIDAQNDEHIWAEKYDGVLDDVFSFQERLSTSIVDALSFVLADSENGPGIPGSPDHLPGPTAQEPRSKPSRRQMPENRRAYEAYLRGRYALRQFTDEGWEEAARLFEHAIELDSEFPPAYVGKAQAWTLPMTGIGIRVDPEKISGARDAIETALALDPESPEAHVWRGVQSMYFDWDWEAGERDLSKAVHLNPNDADGHYWGAWCVGWGKGDFDGALLALEAAEALDPLNLQVPMARGYMYYGMGNQESALAEFVSLKAIDPSFAHAYYSVGDTMAWMGRFDEAIQEFQKCIELGGETTNVLAMLAGAHGQLGEREQAEQYIAKLEDRFDNGLIAAVPLAFAYTGLGDKDTAFHWLEKGINRREPTVVLLGFTHEMDPLRADPRFNDILTRIGLGNLAKQAQ